MCLSDMKLEHNINFKFVYTCSCVLIVFMKLGDNIKLSLYTPVHVYFSCLSDMKLGHNFNLSLHTPVHVYFSCLSNMKLGLNIHLSLYTPAHVYFSCL
jgi:hypothetical protein